MRALRIDLLRSWRTFLLVLPLVVVLCLVFAGILRGLGAAEGGLITLHSYTVGLLIPIAVLTSVYFPVCFAGRNSSKTFRNSQPWHCLFSSY
ncbi:hypothetical protein CPPEL_09670 [Corynebacterium pseudopelargi]|uniref:Uncharacterized protein n=1 Tax=Corynebacterium pseudopelargi TaxID=2080757 RepID=A0A3G6IWK1_9CORY|nr:hypothetical protein CPPEL_09670 [Corynebacterium pseudopelargi]